MQVIFCLVFCRSSFLLSSHFVYGDEERKKQFQKGLSFGPQLPLALAIISGASKTIKLLLGSHIWLKQVDCHGNNFIHSLIAYVAYNPEMEDRLISVYADIVRELDGQDLRNVLHQENRHGLRPLEFAAQHGQGSFVMAILNTPDVYLTKQETHGLTRYKWYNITEYESRYNVSGGSGSRCCKSPLLLMTYVDKARALTDSYGKFIESDAIRSWFRSKLLLNIPLLVFWFFLRARFHFLSAAQ